MKEAEKSEEGGMQQWQSCDLSHYTGGLCRGLLVLLWEIRERHGEAGWGESWSRPRTAPLGARAAVSPPAMVVCWEASGSVFCCSIFQPIVLVLSLQLYCFVSLSPCVQSHKSVIKKKTVRQLQEGGKDFSKLTPLIPNRKKTFRPVSSFMTYMLLLKDDVSVLKSCFCGWHKGEICLTKRCYGKVFNACWWTEEILRFNTEQKWWERQLS